MEQIREQDLTIPKTGTVGYVRIEKPYDNEQLKPRLFKVDDYRFETVG